VSGAALEFGFPIPQVFLDGRADMDLVRRTLLLGERLGFHSAWVQDQVAGDVPIHESLTLLSWAAAVTSKVRLGVSVLVFPIRNAVRRFNEGVAVMKSLWTQPRTDFTGEFYRLANVAMEPKPVQKPHVPLWFGGQHPDALRRAVRHADAWTCAGPNTTAEFAGFVERIRRLLDEAGRDPATLPLSKRVYLAIDADAARAKRRLDEFFGARYPWQIRRNPDFIADICCWGSPGAVAEGLARVVRAGAGTLILNPLWDFEAQLEALATEVIPAVRALAC
jgi:alkanesulfonate monooxygenase SsuD/methylene tetrahydromethanopterin reductase-like flavin-dependent oxidoreductase (luciferase family)